MNNQETTRKIKSFLKGREVIHYHHPVKGAGVLEYNYISLLKWHNEKYRIDHGKRSMLEYSHSYIIFHPEKGVINGEVDIKSKDQGHIEFEYDSLWPKEGEKNYIEEYLEYLLKEIKEEHYLIEGSLLYKISLLFRKPYCWYHLIRNYERGDYEYMY